MKIQLLKVAAFALLQVAHGKYAAVGDKVKDAAVSSSHETLSKSALLHI